MVKRGAGGDPIVGMQVAEGDAGSDSVVEGDVKGSDSIPQGGESEESVWSSQIQ